ncbi:hypothetical protein ABZ784_29325 [Streptomyces tendae]|uniref:hypothetical protein n=1 Tax=Streptomyces tendae TaxID=1932 RepID=UPI0033CE55D4
MSETAPAPQTEATQAEEPPPPPVEDPPPPPVEEPPSEPPPTPDPVPEPDVIDWQPQTWYSITSACVTPGCPQENVIVAIPMFYSNNGELKYIRVVCGADGCCGKDCRILTAEKLDPQPVEE